SIHLMSNRSSGGGAAGAPSSRAAASAGATDESASEPTPSVANAAETVPRRAASSGSRPFARPAAKPPQKASPAPVTSTIRAGAASSETTADRSLSQRSTPSLPILATTSGAPFFGHSS